MEVKEKIINKLGFNHRDKTQLITELNLLIASYHVHYQKLRNFHWNVEGNNFFELHEKFEELYNFSKVNIDNISERIRVFGDKPMASLQEYLDYSKITEPSGNQNADEMVKSILKDFEILIKQTIETLDIANKIGDVSTIDLLTNILKKTEKYFWMFRSYASHN